MIRRQTYFANAIDITSHVRPLSRTLFYFIFLCFSKLTSLQPSCPSRKCKIVLNAIGGCTRGRIERGSREKRSAAPPQLARSWLGPLVLGTFFFFLQCNEQLTSPRRTRTTGSWATKCREHLRNLANRRLCKRYHNRVICPCPFVAVSSNLRGREGRGKCWASGGEGRM